MIRVYDALGRIKEEIDPSTNYVLHVSYVREHFPYTEVDDGRPFGPPAPPAADSDVWRSPARQIAAAKRAETMRRRKEAAAE